MLDHCRRSQETAPNGTRSAGAAGPIARPCGRSPRRRRVVRPWRAGKPWATLAEETAMIWQELVKPVAFVLGGGGSLGAMQVGMLEALVEHAIVPDLVVGTSVGAINGAILAADP